MKEEKLNIRILVDGKMQRLEIERSKEEIVREAAKRLEMTLFTIKKEIQLGDPLEHLRLAALQYAIAAVELEYMDKSSKVTKHLEDIEATLEEYLSENSK